MPPRPVPSHHHRQERHQQQEEEPQQPEYHQYNRPQQPYPPPASPTPTPATRVPPTPLPTRAPASVPTAAQAAARETDASSYIGGVPGLPGMPALPTVPAVPGLPVMTGVPGIRKTRRVAFQHVWPKTSGHGGLHLRLRMKALVIIPAFLKQFQTSSVFCCSEINARSAFYFDIIASLLFHRRFLPRFPQDRSRWC